MVGDRDLICPRCSLPLKQEQVARRNFWVCDNCSGRAVTLELLRQTFTPASINPLWLHAIRGEGTTGCRCPSCRNAMTQVDLSENTAVNVDVCRICHFVWFDSHEIERLVPQPSKAAPEISKKHRETLALAELERIAGTAGGSNFDSAPPDGWWKNIAAFFGG